MTWVLEHPCPSCNDCRHGREPGSRVLRFTSRALAKGFDLARDLLYFLAMSDILRRCLAIVGASLVACFVLHVLRFVTITAEIRGVCAGFVSALVCDYIATRRGRGRRR